MNDQAIKQMVECFNGAMFPGAGVWLDSIDDFQSCFMAANSGEELIAGLEAVKDMWSFVEDGEISMRDIDGRFFTFSVALKCGCERCI